MPSAAESFPPAPGLPLSDEENGSPSSLASSRDSAAADPKSASAQSVRLYATIFSSMQSAEKAVADAVQNTAAAVFRR
jgi:hypothetical protein